MFYSQLAKKWSINPALFGKAELAKYNEAKQQLATFEEYNEFIKNLHEFYWELKTIYLEFSRDVATSNFHNRTEVNSSLLSQIGSKTSRNIPPPFILWEDCFFLLPFFEFQKNPIIHLNSTIILNCSVLLCVCVFSNIPLISWSLFSFIVYQQNLGRWNCELNPQIHQAHQWSQGVPWLVEQSQRRNRILRSYDLHLH